MPIRQLEESFTNPHLTLPNMIAKIGSRFFLPLFGFMLMSMTALGQSASLTANVTTYAPGGGTVTFTATISYATQPTALGFAVGLPSGWSYAGGANEPSIKPDVGTTGTLEWAYSSGFGTGSSMFTFTANYPAGLSGSQTITASAVYRTPLSNMSVTSVVLTPGGQTVAPAITTQPANQSVAAGGNASFSAAASGTPAPTLQWQVSTNSGSTWTNISNGNPYSGASTGTLVITSVTAGMTGYQYRCVAGNGINPDTTSSVATLTVSDQSGPTASLTPSVTTYVSGGGTVTFTATISYTTQPTALGFAVGLPAGWSYAGGANEPSIKPDVGTTGTLEWAYSGNFGTGSSTFTFTANYPAGLTGNQTITASAVYRTPLSNLSVAPVILTPNTPPTISDIANQTIAAGANTGALAFTVGDTETAAGSLTVSGASSNQTLVPVANIVFGGTGASRTVTVTPAAGQSGTATITVTVSDGSLSASDTFVLTATPSITSTATLTANVTKYAAGGGTVTFTAAISYGTQPTALGFAVGLPAGWSYTGGANEPSIKPDVGTTGTLEWAYSSGFGTGSSTFTFTANYPAGLTGNQTITASAVYRTPLSNLNAASVVLTSGYSGIYFGTLSSGGDWALYVRPDSTATYIAYLSKRKSAIVVNLAIDANGAFTVTGTEIVPLTGAASSGLALGSPEATVLKQSAAAATFTFSGQIDSDRKVTGQLAGLDVTLTGAVSAATGDAQAYAGLYTATTLNTGSGATYTIVGASGRTVVVSTTPAAIDGATGTVTSSGQLSVTTSNNAQLSVTLNASAKSMSSSLTPAGSSTPIIGTTITNPLNAHLVNLSSRAAVGTGDNVLIVGFVITGTVPKPVIIRGIGPAFAAAPFNMTGTLPDPVFTLYRSGTVLASNDNWATAGNQATITADMARVGAFSLAPTSLDSVISTTLAPGVYSAVLSGSGTVKTGIGMVEIYDSAAALDPSTPRMVNISSRGFVGTGDNVLIGGFVVTGNQPRQVLIRGVGPTLATLGVTAPVLSDPIITLNHGGTVINQNDNWGSAGDGTAISSTATAVGAFALPSGSKDASVLTALQPGAYTVIVSGANNTTGIALVEIYEVGN
jgi:hypothetical protein